MSTFFLQANDTLVLQTKDTLVMTDSIVAKLTNSANTCMSCLDKAATNQADVEIAELIMHGIVAIAIISFVGLILMRLIANSSKKHSEERKRKWEEEDKGRKQKSELLSMKLELLKEQCYILKDRTEVNECSETKKTRGQTGEDIETKESITNKQKHEKVLKASDDEDVKKYLAELDK